MAGQRPRDFQRSKVYAWERQVTDPPMREERIRDIREVRALTDRVLAEHGLSWAPGTGRQEGRSFFAFKEHLVYWKRGSRSGRYDAGGWCGYRAVGQNGVPRFQELRVSSGKEIILHEIAHLILDQVDGVRREAGHGPRFVRALIELLSRYSDAWRGKEGQLILSAHACGIACSSTPVLAPIWKAVEAPKPIKPRKPRVASTCKRSPGSIVRQIARANPTLAFAEIVRLAVAEGVNPNTARGALVRFKQSQRKEIDG
jgi:hypothetical protein